MLITMHFCCVIENKFALGRLYRIFEQIDSFGTEFENI
jgi:hypothetical protein